LRRVTVAEVRDLHAAAADTRRSAVELARETGVHRDRVYRWARKARKRD